MPRHVTFAILLVAVMLAKPPLATAGRSGTPSPAVALRECLAKRAGSRRFATWGVQVKELPSGKTLFSHNAELASNPASNLKLITASAALQLLGPRYRFATEVYGRLGRHGVVEEGLYLRGAGDPSLTTAHLERLALALKARGVRAVRGPLYLDTTSYQGSFDPPGYRRFRSSSAFRAGVAALSLNHNAVRVAVTPGAAPGDPPRVVLAPPSPYFTVKLRARTTGWRTRLTVSTHSRPGVTEVKVKGRINVRSRPRVFWRRVFDPPLYAGQTLLGLLRHAGIRVSQPRVRLRRIRGQVVRLARSLSPQLGEIVRSGTKYSSNTIADHLLLALGAERYGRPATFAKGLRVLGQYLERFGVKPGTYRLENGSGLSRRSRIRPVDLIRVLEGIHRDFSARPDLMAALPLAGVDGTLRRRFKRSRAKRLVRAKTGTLSGVSCLSGYAGGVGGRVLLFAFMASKVRQKPAVLWQQTAMSGCLVDYLRAASGAGQ